MPAIQLLSKNVAAKMSGEEKSPSDQFNEPQKPNSTSHVHAKLFDSKPKAAFHAVFDTMELAEMILGEICMRDLLISVQRVCKGWKSTIDASSKLQEALFFRPINSKCLIYGGRTCDEHFAMARRRELTAETLADQSGPVYEHPIITAKCSKIRNYGAPWYHMPNAEIMGRPEASWRRQLMTQPPLAELRWRKTEDETKVNGTVRASSPKGLTLGDCAMESSIRLSSWHERWSWQGIDWDFAPAVLTIEPARFAAYTEGQWISERADIPDEEV